MGRPRLFPLYLLSSLFLAVGCGSDSDPIPVPAEELPTTASADGGTGLDYDPFEGEPIRPHIAFIAGGDSPFWRLAGAGGLAAGKELDVKVDVRYPGEGKPEEQTAFGRELMRAGCSAMAVGPVDPENQVKWINRVFGMIELVTFGVDSPESDRMMHIGTDDYAAGRACGELLKKALPDGGSVALMIDDLNGAKSRLRRQGVIDALVDRDRDLAFYQGDSAVWDDAAKPVKGETFTILGTLVDDGDAQVAKDKATQLLGKVDDLAGIVGLNEASIPTCLEVLQEADRLGKVKVVGFGTADATLNAIQDGNCDGVVAEDAFEYGAQAVRKLYWILGLRKDAIPESGLLSIPFETVTAENLDEFQADLKEKLAAAEETTAEAS